MIKIKHLGDITKLNGAEISVVDCIIGGSPCQDLSVAGLRKGMLHSDKGDEETTRSGLFMEQLRIIKEMREHEQKNGRTPRPRLMVWENVPGAFSSNDGDDFRAVLEETARVVDPTATIPRPEGSWSPSGCILGRGWSIAWRVHDAQFWGVAQRRRRIALVADFGGESAPSLLFESKGMSGDTEPSRETGKGTSPSTSSCIDDTSRTEIEDFVDAVNSSAVHQQDLIQSDLGISRTLAPGTHASGSHLTKTLITSSAEDSDFIFQQNQNFAVTYGVDTYNQTAEEEVSAKLKSGGEQPKVMVAADTDVTYCLQGNGIDRADTAGCNGKGWKEDIAYTLNTIDRPAVVSIDMGGGKSSCVISNEQAPTLTTTHDGAPAIVHLASGKEVAGCLMASGYDKLGAQEMFSGDYLVIEEPTDAVTLETFNCTSEEELAPPLKASDYKEPLVVFSKSRRAKDKDDYTTWVESNVANTLNAFDQGEVRTNELVIEEPPIVTTYSQDSFDEFSENNVSSALRHSGGPAGYGGNAIVVESHPTTNDVIAFEPGAASRLGTGVYSNVSGCLRASMGDNQMAVVYGIDQQGGKGSANYTENVSPTILSESHGTPNAVAYGFDPSAARDVGELFLEETSKTLSNGTCPGHHNGVVVSNEDTDTIAYNIDSEHSNSMKSDNPNSGFHETSVAKTLDTSSQNPGRQQGGTVLVQDVYSVENHPADSRVDLGEDGSVQTLTGRMGTGGGNVPLVALGIDAYNLQSTEDATSMGTANDESTMMPIENQPQTIEEDVYGLDRASYNQGQNAKFGFQVEKNISPTQLAAGPSAVATVGALCYDDYKGANNQYVDQNKVVTSPVVRRLTPLECERLQGFPDGWTKLDSWVDTKGKTHTNSDSARYKALGNSIAIPFWDWLLGRIHHQYNRVATLGSLFDGIGGFPYCWEKHNGVGTALWASEIEEFPIAVTKVHFPEVDVENYPWWADYCKAVEQEKPVEITESKFSASPKKHKLF